MTFASKIGNEYIPSFVDLRRFAARQEGWSSGSGGFLGERRFVELPDGPVTVGVLRLDGPTGPIPPLDADEFIILVEGIVSLQMAEGKVTLTAGQSAVLPYGSHFSCDAQAATLIFMRCQGDGLSGASPTMIDEMADLQPSGPPLAELLVGPTPSCRNHNDFKSVTGEFVCGTWDSTPYQRHAMPYRHYELMHLLDGSVTFEDSTKQHATFHKGDIFLVEQGARCSWLSEVPVKKVFAIYRPN